jgi:polysaccharide deacetylase 2 family uncharacterized protein YibQ
MGSSKKRRNRPKKAPLRSGVWIAFVGVALALGFVGGYLFRGVPRPPIETPVKPDILADIEAVLGPLGDGTVHVQVPARESAEDLLSRLESIARRASQRVTLSKVTRRPGTLRGSVTVDAAVYPFQIQWYEVPEVAPPRLAIVIDDMGQDLGRARAFLELKIPITPSILPHLPASRAVALLARERGRDYLLHLPMQPQGYPQVNPGRGALTESMDRAELGRVIAENLESVPGAVGCNNHMGSRLTELPTPMGWVMAELRERGLYFLDSVTSSRSVAARVARESKTAWARRDVFLDNVRETGAIGKQIEKAIKRARQTGQAIAIGHPHRTTLNVLKQWIPKISEAGMEVVPLGELVQRGNGV